IGCAGIYANYDRPCLKCEQRGEDDVTRKDSFLYRAKRAILESAAENYSRFPGPARMSQTRTATVPLHCTPILPDVSDIGRTMAASQIGCSDYNDCCVSI